MQGFKNLLEVKTHTHTHMPHGENDIQPCLIICDPIDCSLPRSSVHMILQVRILKRVSISFSRASFQPRDQTRVSCIAGGFFTV